MPKNKTLTTPVKEAIAQACEGGRRGSDVARDFGVDKSVVSRIFKDKREGNSLKRRPSRSPDLSPIENVWAIVKQKLAGKRFRSHDEVWEATLEAWNSISAAQLMKLVESMPRRLESVIKANGGPTKY